MVFAWHLFFMKIVKVPYMQGFQNFCNIIHLSLKCIIPDMPSYVVVFVCLCLCRYSCISPSSIASYYLSTHLYLAS